MNNPSPRRFVSARWLLPLAGVFLATGSLEAANVMRHQPERLRLDTPFEVNLAADYAFEVISTDFQGLNYVIMTRRLGPSTPGVLNYFHTVTLEGPPNDTWPILNYLEWRELAGATEIVLERRRINFIPAVKIQAPATITDQDSLVVEIFGRAQCPSYADGPYGWPDGTIQVGYSDGCAGIGSFEQFRFTSDPGGPFEAGRYRLVLREISNYPDLIGQELEVLPTQVRLLDGRFAIDLRWDDGTATGNAKAAKMPGRDSAVLYFFDPANWEFLVKVLDGCAINGHYWVFGSASTAVGYTLEVRDLERPELGARTYANSLDQPAAAITDTAAFPCTENQP